MTKRIAKYSLKYVPSGKAVVLLHKVHGIGKGRAQKNGQSVGHGGGGGQVHNATNYFALPGNAALQCLPRASSLTSI